MFVVTKLNYSTSLVTIQGVYKDNKTALESILSRNKKKENNIYRDKINKNILYKK